MDALNCNWLENTKEGNFIKRNEGKLYTALVWKSKVESECDRKWVRSHNNKEEMF